MSAANKPSDGFCAPILWGAINGYQVAEIADGLGIGEETVIAVIEQHSGVRYPRPLSAPTRVIKAKRFHPYAVDETRTDTRYRAWLATRRAARRQRYANAGLEP